jgi:hypothetical protein
MLGDISKTDGWIQSRSSVLALLNTEIPSAHEQVSRVALFPPCRLHQRYSVTQITDWNLPFSRTALDECDYNIHLSNSSYAKVRESII